MNAKKSIKQLTDAVLAELKNQSYGQFTISRYRSTYNKLLEYAKHNSVEYYSETVGLDFMYQEFGYRLEGFFGKVPSKESDALHHLMLLWHYQEYSTVEFITRGKKKKFQCPTAFVKEYEAFQDYCRRKEYTQMGMNALLPPVQNFFLYINANKIQSFDEITNETVNTFFTAYADRSIRYIATIGRNIFKMLYEEKFACLKLWEFVPRVSYSRNAFIPPSWKKEDVLKLLGAIDRGSPVGKRNYAILLLVVRLGLRASDIKALNLSNLDWNKKKISIIQTKTKNRLELPLLDDVGWALIDYLRNGRPKTRSTAVFINHKAPYGAFKMTNGLQHILYKCMRFAGIEIPKDEHCGLHSLRSTLARTMLESGAPLPVISDVLGHESVQSTSVYLKINLDALRKCPIDPEEVFLSE